MRGAAKVGEGSRAEVRASYLRIYSRRGKIRLTALHIKRLEESSDYLEAAGRDEGKRSHSLGR